MAKVDTQAPMADGLNEKLISVTRTAKTVKGGRIMSFRALVVVGDGKGRIGYGIGKSREVPNAIKKAMDDAKSNMVKIDLKENTLFHKVIGRHGASKVVLLPASKGTGIIAGGAVRAVCEVIGIENILAKTIGSTNGVNVVRAVVNGLKSMHSPEWIADKRGKSVKDLRLTKVAEAA